MRWKFTIAALVAAGACAGPEITGSDTTNTVDLTGFPQPAPGALTRVSFRPCITYRPEDLYILVGGGQWTKLSADASGKYAADVTPQVAIRYGYSYELNLRPQVFTEILYLTAQELAELDCPSAVGREHINQFGTPLTANGKALYARTTAIADVTMAAAGTRIMSTTTASGFVVPQGPTDVVASTALSNGAPKVIIRRGVNASSGDTLPLLDFGSAEALPLENWALTGWPPGSSSHSSCSTRFYTGMTDSWALELPEGTSPVTTLAAVPSALLQAGDMHRLACISVDDVSSNSSGSTSLVYAFAQGRAISLPDPGFPAVTATRLAKHVMAVELPTGAQQPAYIAVTLSYPGDAKWPPAGTRVVQTYVTKGYLAPQKLVFALPPAGLGDTTVAPGASVAIAMGHTMLSFGTRPADGEALWRRTTAIPAAP